MNINRTFSNFNHTLENMTCIFLDYMCGELDVNLEDYQEEYDFEDNVYTAEVNLTSGDTYHVCICLDEDDNEWVCIAEKAIESMVI